MNNVQQQQELQIDPTLEAATRLDWRKYFGAVWDRRPDWSKDRLAGFMSAEEGRRVELLPDSGVLDPDKPVVTLRSIVQDLPDRKGPFIGVISSHDEGSGVVQFNDAGHLLTIAPTRTGKGAGHIVPNLLLYAGSMVVIDIKGENHAITSNYRGAFYDGAGVLKFAPFEKDTDCYNPLDFIRTEESGAPTIDTFDDARLLAEMLVPGGKSRDAYWDIESRNVATMLILYVATRYARDSSLRTMAEVARLLFRTDGDDNDSGFTLSLNEIITFSDGIRYPPLQSLVYSYREHERRLQDNILSSCRADMRIWTINRLQDATSRSDFQFADLKGAMCRPVINNPAPLTLYIIVPPEYLESYRPVLRLMIGLATIELTRPGRWRGNAEQGWRDDPPCPVLFMLDELPALGHMSPIVNGLSYLAGYGVQLWSFAQNIGQLQEIYGKAWHNFPANAAVSCYFGVNDPDTAEFVASQLGETQEIEHRYMTMSTTSSTSSGSSSGGNIGNYSSSDGRSDSTTDTEHVRFHREPLARASDVRATHKDLQYVFVRNRPPILATRIDYYNFPLFHGHFEKWRG